MSKKIILFFVSIIFFSGFNLAQAEVIVNEILYSPTSKQWIEVYNDGGNAVDLSEYKILDTGASVNGHGISLCSSELSPNSYAVIAKVPEDFSNSTFTICKSSLGIKVSEDVVKLKNSLDSIVDTVNTDGSATEGNSWQLVNGSWIAATPTPGAENQASISTDDGNEEEQNESENDDEAANDQNDTASPAQGGSRNSSSSSKTKKVKESKIMAKILANTVAFSGQPLVMQTAVSGLSGKKVVLGRAYWNFGDGGSLEQINNFGKFFHTYYYPGDYVVFLEYYSKSSSLVPDATSKVIIKVLPITVSISKVGDARDFFLELSNNANSDIDISGWILSANGKNFVLPKNSVIMSKKSITISSKITGFNYSDRQSLKLFSSTGELVFDYSAPLASLFSTVKNKNTSSNPPKTSALPAEGAGLTTSMFDLAKEIPIENLEAAAIKSDILKDNSDNAYLPMLISLVFIGGSAAAVYLIRQKRAVSEVGDDFKILDE